MRIKRWVSVGAMLLAAVLFVGGCSWGKDKHDDHGDHPSAEHPDNGAHEDNGEHPDHPDHPDDDDGGGSEHPDHPGR